MSHEAYKRTQSMAARPRDAEYLVFSRVTADLIAVEGQGRTDLARVADVVTRNRQLWGILSGDCADGRNRLPEKTRAAIISLDLFVQRYSRGVIRNGDSAQPLIDINRMIMDGLAGREVPMKQ